MPEENANGNSNDNPAPKPKSRNERTEAKFLEDADKLIAEAEREGAEYDAPNAIAKLPALQAKRAAVAAQRTVNQQDAARLEADRNKREPLFKACRSDCSSLIEYAKSAGASKEDVDALRSIQREMRGVRAGTAGANSISVSHQSYASLADTYSRIIEQYDTLGLKPTETMYKTETYRDKLAVMRQATADVIQSEAKTDSSGEAFDRLAYTDADSLLKGCVSGKSYIKSKYKTTGQPYKNIAATRFNIPSRLR